MALAFSPDGRGYLLIPEGKKPTLSFIAERTPCAEYEAPEDLGEVESPILEEVSGLALSRRFDGLLWAVNDSGHGNSRTILSAIGSDGQSLADTELPEIMAPRENLWVKRPTFSLLREGNRI